MLWVEKNYIWNLYVYHVYIQWFEKTRLHVYIAPLNSCRYAFDHLIICFIYCMNININSVCIGLSLQHLHSLPPRSRTHCLSWHLLQPKQAELAESAGIRNKKPILNHVIHIFCSLKATIRIHFEECLQTWNFTQMKVEHFLQLCQCLSLLLFFWCHGI